MIFTTGKTDEIEDRNTDGQMALPANLSLKDSLANASIEVIVKIQWMEFPSGWNGWNFPVEQRGPKREPRNDAALK